MLALFKSHWPLKLVRAPSTRSSCTLTYDPAPNTAFHNTDGVPVDMSKVIEAGIPSALDYTKRYKPSRKLLPQTLRSALQSSNKSRFQERLVRHIQTPDGGNIAFNISSKFPLPELEEVAEDHHSQDASSGSELPVILAVHGVTGHANAAHVQEALQLLYEAGCPVASLTLRGCGDLPLTSPAIYNAGQTEDLMIVAAEVAKILPERNMHGIGFSLGGGIVLNTIGEMGDKCPLTSCATISNVLDYEAAAKCLEAPFPLPRIINYRLGGQHLALLSKNKHVFDIGHDFAPLGLIPSPLSSGLPSTLPQTENEPWLYDVDARLRKAAFPELESLSATSSFLSASQSSLSTNPSSQLSSPPTPGTPSEQVEVSKSRTPHSQRGIDYGHPNLAAVIREAVTRTLPGVTMTRISDRVISTTAGFSDGKAFREATSSKHAIASARIPYLAINAKDDVLFKGSHLPVDAFRKSSHAVLMTTKDGGHLGFFEKKIGTERECGRYSARALMDWVMGIEGLSPASRPKPVTCEDPVTGRTYFEDRPERGWRFVSASELFPSFVPVE